MPFRSGARLRLRPPRPARRTVALPRPAAVLLVLLLVGALGAAYQLYLNGIPGTPRLPKWEDELFPNPVGSSVGVLAPPGVVFRQRVSLGKVEHYGSDTPVRTFGEPDPMLGLDPGTIHLSLQFVEYEPVPFDLVLALEGGARVPDDTAVRAFSWDADGAQVAVDGPFADYVVLHVTPKPPFVHENGETSRWSMDLEVLLRPQWPFAVRDNARAVLRTPLFHPFAQCANLSTFVRNLKEGIRQPGAGCDRPEQPLEEETTVLLAMERAEWKSDLLFPAPGEGVRSDLFDTATWWTTSGAIRVTGNYVNINAEAAGQRLLFLSGLLAGFALGLVPVAVEKIRFPRGRKAVRGRGSLSRRS
ncbi:hypothetical protein [Lentzea sp. NPDC051838]|uniref:hypothetical protein n=1 Tax=Lentzea sp. NPDC051838 TaxID=3154849 RepID=UPI003430F923